MAGTLKLKWSRYVPKTKIIDGVVKPFIPHPKQLAFMMLPHEEKLFGGAAGGGKTETILMDHLRWLDTPGYRGLILRRKLTEHTQANATFSRCKEWLAPFLASKEIKLRGTTFTSKEGASVSFGYLDKEGSQNNYQTAEFHKISFDEATHFSEEELTYMFSRVRRTGTTIPYGVTLCTNPGSRGHAFIKKRFAIWRDPDGQFRGHDPSRPFIQSTVADNPTVGKEYLRMLDQLAPVVREQLRNGDWDAVEEAVFKDFWFAHRWKAKQDKDGKDEFYILEHPVRGTKVYRRNDLLVFTSIDCAASEKTGITDKVFYANSNPSWTVCGVFGMTPDWQLIWLDNWRDQIEIPAIIKRIALINRLWKPAYNIVENNSPNLGVLQGLRDRGLSILPDQSVPGKLVRSTNAQIRAERGQIWLPEEADWLPDLEDELFVWAGSDKGIADQIDVLSMAAKHVARYAAGGEVEAGLQSGTPYQQAASTGGLRGLPEPPKHAISHLRREGGRMFSPGPPLGRGISRSPLYAR